MFTVAGGYLSLEDTVVEKPYARLLGEAAWVWSSKQRKVVFGVSVVLLGWTDGQVPIPLACRLWHKGGPSKFTLALELLSYARNRLHCEPPFGYRRRGPEVSRSRSSAPEHHIALCLVAYLIVERERLNQGVPWRKFKQRLILTGRQVPLPPWSG